MTYLYEIENQENGTEIKTDIHTPIDDQAHETISINFVEMIGVFKEFLKEDLAIKNLDRCLPKEDEIVRLRNTHHKRFLFKEEDYEILENIKLNELRHKIHPLVDAVLQDTNMLMTWVKLLIPKAACGNNWGVEVQEDALKKFEQEKELAYKEIEKVNKAAQEFLKELDNFDHSKRTKLGTEYLKNPQISFVAEIRDLDRKFFGLMRNNLAKLCDGLLILKDHLLKNMDKITNPRGEERSTVYTS